MYKSFFKRLLDFTISLAGFIVILPLFVLITIFLAIVNNGKPFFTQQRPGKNEKIFKIIKFKTMNDKKDELGNLLPPAERITPIGNLIRKTSLDEIPQLLNVIKGDMSLIGPRPLRIEYLPLYSLEQRHRHDVRPGITGWAQIKGRNSLSWEEKFDLDIYYINHLGLTLDVKILFMTINKVIRRSDINQTDNTPTTPFKGIKLNS